MICQFNPNNVCFIFLFVLIFIIRHSQVNWNKCLFCNLFKLHMSHYRFDNSSSFWTKLILNTVNHHLVSLNINKTMKKNIFFPHSWHTFLQFFFVFMKCCKIIIIPIFLQCIFWSALAGNVHFMFCFCVFFFYYEIYCR